MSEYTLTLTVISLMVNSDAIETTFKDTLISFGTSESEADGHTVKLLAGIPNGLITTEYQHNMSMRSFSTITHQKITLTKNQPVYLAAWSATTKNSLRSLNSENGELPEGLEDNEITILYKVEWTEKTKH
ncbi:hypothetical protein QYG89_11195 [Bacillus sp. B190/17]|uniref:DUF3277 domain-containing protein n=1 Tax=Bacillus lumedeiriae TaxID=3058829 RepID=A0ABW8I9R1_9BACI